ncbi:MAG TPA: response regulator [Flavobacteriales bacterium]|jgi:CheY-like chemotaxis protein|nr:response regulator [Salibacteraceae bacterium]HAQ69801.1 response regulator [Flavobacteriales bacterium]
MKVCVIDDDDIYQFLLKKELKHTNLVDKIQVFTDGQKAIDYFIENKKSIELLPDVIFLDINMPIMNGWQSLEQFKQIQPKIAKEITIYLVSSSFDDRDINRSKEYTEVTDYIIKPVKRSNLLSVLREIE